jgi:hypothetical protein
MAARSVSVPLHLSRPQLPVADQPIYRVRPRPQNANSIEELSLSELRGKIRRNRVSFPAQVPIFEKHDRPDLQQKTVQLYFLFGWSCSRIAQRYGVLRQRIQQILSTWKRRAIQMGYIQEIPPAMPARDLGPGLPVSRL